MSVVDRSVGRRPLHALATLAVVAVVAGCTGADGSGPATGGGAAGTAAPAYMSAPGAHVHAVAISPFDGVTYAATHEGLFRLGDGEPQRLGPTVDLMGFTIAGPDRFLASGHPGPSSDLPEPLGLAESRDGGRSWVSLSRGGKSDFHALAAVGTQVLAFDGRELVRSDDGETWQALEVPATPHALAASPHAATVLATSESGLLRSPDAGTTWQPVPGAPLLQVAAFADATTAFGVTPDGVVARSDDGGERWTSVADLGEAPHAIGARRTADGAVRVVVANAQGLTVSDDGGLTFHDDL